MLKKISFIIIGILCSQGILKSQTSEQADSLFYKLGFSTYLSHTDRFASGFDICTDKEGYIYIYQEILKIGIFLLRKELIKLN